MKNKFEFSTGCCQALPTRRISTNCFDKRWIKSPAAEADSEAEPQSGNRKLGDTDVVVKRVLAKALKAAVERCASYYNQKHRCRIKSTQPAQPEQRILLRKPAVWYWKSPGRISSARLLLGRKTWWIGTNRAETVLSPTLTFSEPLETQILLVPPVSVAP